MSCLAILLMTLLILCVALFLLLRNYVGSETASLNAYKLVEPARGAPLEIRDFQSLSPERQIIWRHWAEQFENLRVSGISQEDMDQLSEKLNTLGVLRVKIIKGKIYHKFYSQNTSASRRVRFFLTFLSKVVSQYPIPDVDFLVFIMGEGIDKFSRLYPHMPLFAYDLDPTNPTQCKNNILIPDVNVLAKGPALLRKIKAAHGRYPWERKQEKMMWRGSTTGEGPRFALVEMAKQFPQKIDAYFIFQYNKMPRDLKTLNLFFKGMFGIGESRRVPEAEHLASKYLVSMDGNVSAWLRPVWIMASNSVLLFQYQWEQWFYKALVPEKHYVPLKPDLSDLLEKHDWLKSHDEEARAIVKNANDFVEAVFQPAFLAEDMAFVLTAYASLQRFTPVAPAPEEISASFVDGLFSKINRWVPLV